MSNFHHISAFLLCDFLKSFKVKCQGQAKGNQDRGQGQGYRSNLKVRLDGHQSR